MIMTYKQEDIQDTLIDVGEKPLIMASPEIMSEYHDETGNPVPGKWIKGKQLFIWDFTRDRWHKVGLLPTVDFVLEQVQITDESQKSDYDHSIVVFNPDDFKPYKYFYKETNQRVN